MIVTEFAPAKINLTLRVRGRRPDGYHALESLVAFASIGDTLEYDPSGAQGLTVDGPFAQAIDGANLIDQVVARTRALLPIAEFGAFRLHKRLPVAAGIGGGSADAAAALRALARAHPQWAETFDIADVAPALGSDVPVCVLSRTAMMWGTGERLRVLPNLPPASIVLVNPTVKVATGPVFQRLAAPHLRDGAAIGEPEFPLPFANTMDLARYVSSIGNDLERPAIEIAPVIGDVKQALASTAGCLYAGQSGSGATCFGLFAESDGADTAAMTLRRTHPLWWIESGSLL